MNDSTYKQASHITTGNFYGIGYTRFDNVLLQLTSDIDKWGMYVGANGKIGCFLDGEGANSFINADNSGNVGIGTKYPIGKLHVQGDIRIDKDNTITTTDWNYGSFVDPTPSVRAMELLKHSTAINTGRCIGLGQATENLNQTELWFQYHGSGSYNNFGHLGLFGDDDNAETAIAFGAYSGGSNVAIGYSKSSIGSNWHSKFNGKALSVNGNTKIDKNPTVHGVYSGYLSRDTPDSSGTDVPTGYLFEIMNTRHRC